MFDQSFNIENINKVFTIANNKGIVKKDFLSKEYLDKCKEYSKLRKEITSLKRNLKIEPTEEVQEKISKCEKQLNKNAVEQKELLSEHFFYVSQRINKRGFKFNLTVSPSGDDKKPNYVIGKTPEEFFAMQILCQNLKHAFKLKMSGRNEVLQQIKLFLQEDDHHKYIIRTDVENCFESIPHKLLFETIDDNTILDFHNKSILKRLICDDFEKINTRQIVKTENCGVPRGCAVSSYLTEFYLSKIDREILSKVNNIAYYNRYVDDVFIVIYPDSVNNIDDYMNIIINIFKEKGLTLSKNKTKKIDMGESSLSAKFDMLGYNFHIKDKKLKISHSEKKSRKIINRIELIFNEFEKKTNEHNLNSAISFLFDSLKILTANTSLHNNKKGIKIGAYYSNVILEDSSCLHKYDCIISSKINNIKLPIELFTTDEERMKFENNLKTVLERNVSFKKGFDEIKTFCISKNRLQNIKNIWTKCEKIEKR